MEGTEGTEFALGESVQENFALGTEVQVLQVTLELEHETRRDEPVVVVETTWSEIECT